MNKKILTAILLALFLCSCANKTQEQSAESFSETSSVISDNSEMQTETTMETTTTAVSTESKEITETAAPEENKPITKDFFDDDVIFEEVMLPVKIILYKGNETYETKTYEYDAAGNILTESRSDRDGIYKIVYEYDYDPSGISISTSIKIYSNDRLLNSSYYNEKGYCIKEIDSHGTDEYNYEFDSEGRLIKKKFDRGSTEYTYDENGRLQEEYDDFYGRKTAYRHEYGNGYENVYLKNDYTVEEKLRQIIEFDVNGNIIKETIDVGAGSEYAEGKEFAEYEYDSMNRLVYENHTVSEDFMVGNDATYVYSYTYEYEGDKLKKETYSYFYVTTSTEYFYDDSGRLIKEIYICDGTDDMNGYFPTQITTEYIYSEDGTITSYQYGENGILVKETEYALIEQIKTDIEYLNYFYVDAE